MSTAIHRSTAQVLGVCCILILVCGVLEAFCGILWRYFETNGWSTGKWLFDGFQGVWSGVVVSENERKTTTLHESHSRFIDKISRDVYCFFGGNMNQLVKESVSPIK